jgi:mRNA interferase RelE/StbE
MSIHRLQFLPVAKVEWDKLDHSVRQQFAKALLKRLEHPRVSAAALSGMPDCYKIKLRSSGFRLVYQVHDDALILLTIAVGKRDKSSVYSAALQRLVPRLTRQLKNTPSNAGTPTKVVRKKKR